jgi:ABC-2 type transport system permease protein
MATAIERTRPTIGVADRIVESIDPTCVRGIAAGLATWLVLGYGLEWLGGRLERANVTAIGSTLWYGGMIVVLLLVLRWVGYVASPRLATLLDREVGAFFLSPIAYLVLIGMLVVTTINFWDLVQQLSDVRTEVAGEASPIISFVAYNLWFWLGMLFVIPVVTMRLLSEEKRSGTIEVLMTAPVTELHVVLSKYLATLLFYCVLVSPSAVFLIILRSWGKFEFELLPVYAVYIGMFTMGAMFLSIGLFFSSVTRNQIIAAMLTFAMLLLMFATFVLHWYAQRSTTFGVIAPVIKYIAVLPHLYELGTGKMDIKFLLFHLSVATFMLFVTVKVVEARKWR